MSSRYSVVCMTCRYQSAHSSRWEANIDIAAHLRDNPTHSVTVVEEGQGRAERVLSDDLSRLIDRLATAGADFRV
jgi:hypothetical protein